jgi:16S rRNA G966 N2-methylase RsmD
MGFDGRLQRLGEERPGASARATAVAVVEEAAKAEIAAPDALALVDERRYGETRVLFFAAAAREESIL